MQVCSVLRGLVRHLPIRRSPAPVPGYFRRVSTRFQPDDASEPQVVKQATPSERRNLIISAGDAPEGTTLAIDWALNNLVREGAWQIRCMG